MRKTIAGVLFALFAILIATGLTFANTGVGKWAMQKAAGPPEVNFTASLDFTDAMNDHVQLKLTNYGSETMEIARQAYYMDQIGSAGSWDCCAGENTKVKPGQTKWISFQITDVVAHGELSVLAFYFHYAGRWYLGKVGEANGIEYFAQHN